MPRKSKQTCTNRNNVKDFRHTEARRKNNPPAGIAPTYEVRERQTTRYEYEPHLDPKLQGAGILKRFCDRVYDPCCGSSGMFVQSVEFIEAHATGNGNNGPGIMAQVRAQISIYGQELNYTPWRLAKTNQAICGIEGRIEQGDTLRDGRIVR
ncbi:MAG: hypothetical protein C4303_08195 [candidate division GAL15 bacterium]